MFRRDHVILSFQNSQTLQFFIFVTFCAFQAVFTSMLGPFYTKSRDLNCGLSFPSNSWYWHVGLWKVAIIINWEFFHWLLFSVLLSPEKSLMAQAQTDHRVLARSNKSSMNFWKLTNVKSAGLWTVKTNVLFTHVYDFFGRLGTIEDVLIKIYLKHWYKSVSSCSTYTNKLLSLVFIFNVQYFIKINVNIVWQLSLQTKNIFQNKTKSFQLTQH